MHKTKEIFRVSLVVIITFSVFILSFLLLKNRNIKLSGAAGTSDVYSISSVYKNSPIVLKTSGKFAGGIYSLQWNGKEFLNGWDHGRQLQSTISFNGYGGCLNPTEAGNIMDGTGDTSSSVLKEVKVYANELFTKNQMAFWMPPEYSGYPSADNPYCGYTNRSEFPVGVAQNKTVLSNVFLDKHVKLGAYGMPNVIEYSVRFNVDQYYTSTLFETLTAHMPAEFSSLWSYNPKTKALSVLNGGGGYPSYSAAPPNYDVVRDQMQDYPVIISTPDKQYAMGIFVPDASPRFTGPGYGSWEYGIRSLGYGRWIFDNANLPPNAKTTKWNVMFRGGKTTPGIYPFIHYVAIGTLNDVTTAIDNLYLTQKGSVSRGEASNIIANAFSLNSIDSNPQIFVDVPPSKPFYNAVQRFSVLGISQGCALQPAKFYCYDRYTTRGESATFLLRAAGYKPNTSDTTPVFADVPSTHPLFPWIQLFYRKGFTIGCSTNPLRFCPDNPIRRDDLNTFVSRVKSSVN